METFREHPTYTSFEGSNLGNIRLKISNDKVRRVKPTFYETRGFRLNISARRTGGGAITIMARRFIWECFHGLLPEKACISHKDGNLEIVALDNLELTNQTEINRKSQVKRDMTKIGYNTRDKVKKMLAENVDSKVKLLFDSKSQCAKYFSVTPTMIYYAYTKMGNIKQINSITGSWIIRDPTDEELQTAEHFTTPHGNSGKKKKVNHQTDLP